MNYSKRKIQKIVKKLLLSDQYNFKNLKRRSKIDDLVFDQDLNFDVLNMFDFKCSVEDLNMTVGQFVNKIQEILKGDISDD